MQVDAGYGLDDPHVRQVSAVPRQPATDGRDLRGGTRGPPRPGISHGAPRNTPSLKNTR
jgi:hypothetical protein